MTNLKAVGRAAFASDGRLDFVCLALVLATAGLVAWNARREITSESFHARAGLAERTEVRGWDWASLQKSLSAAGPAGRAGS